MSLELNLSKLFDKEEWNSSVKVVQKDMGYMFRNKCNEYEEDFHYVDCLKWMNIDISNFDKDIVDNVVFGEMFDSLCKDVIDKDFIMFRNEFDDNKSWVEQFSDEHHGTGVCSLLYMLYEIKSLNYKCIVIDNIDGVLHPLSMERLCHVLKNQDKYKIIFLMNNDTLFTNSIMDIKDLYILDEDVITNIQQCTDRELRPSHNLQTMYRAGEFNKRKEDD